MIECGKNKRSACGSAGGSQPAVLKIHFVKPLPAENMTVRISAMLDGRRLTQAETLNGGTVTLEEDGDELLLHLDHLEHYEAVVVSWQGSLGKEKQLNKRQ